MDRDNFDVYPISHNGRVYNVITAMDLTFREVRGMIDALVALGCSPPGPMPTSPGTSSPAPSRDSSSRLTSGGPMWWSTAASARSDTGGLIPLNCGVRPA